MSPSRRSYAAAIFFINIALELVLVTGAVSGPTFQRCFALTDTQLGIVLGSVNLGLLLMAPLAGHITRRYGCMTSLLLGMACSMVGIMVVWGAVGFLTLALGVALVGVSMALLANANTTLLADLFPATMRRMMSLAAAIWFISAALASPLVGLWLDHARERGMGRWGYRVPYAAVFLLMMVGTLLCFTVLRRAIGEVEAERRAAPKPPSHELARSSSMAHWIWVPLAAFFHNFLAVALLNWLNPMMQKSFGVNELRGSIAVAAFAMGIGLGRLTFAFLRTERDERQILTVTAMAGAGFYAAGLAAPNFPVSVLLIGLGGLAGSPVYPCILSLTGRLFPHARANMYALLHASVGLAGLLAPAAVGALADGGMPVRLALGVSPLCGVLLAMVAMLWDMHGRRTEDEPEL